jgi:hypothetical protein
MKSLPCTNRGIADDALPHAHSILYTWGGLQFLAPDI